MKKRTHLSTLVILILALLLLVAAQPEPTPQALKLGFYGDPQSLAALGARLAVGQIESEPFSAPDGNRYIFTLVASQDPAALRDAVAVLALPEDENAVFSAPPVWEMPVILLDTDAPLALRGAEALVFRGMSNRAALDDMLADYLVRQMGVSRAMVVGADEKMLDYAARITVLGGVQVQIMPETLLTAADFQELLAFEPQLLLYGGDAASAQTLLQELGEQDWRGFFLYPETLERVAGVRVVGVDAWNNRATDDLSRAFINSYIAAYDREPDASALAAYDLTWALRLLITRNGAEPLALAAFLPNTPLIRTTQGTLNPALYGGAELYRSALIFERGGAVLARYDGGFLIDRNPEVAALPSPTPIPSPTPTEARFSVTVDTLNVRTGPADGYAIIGQLIGGEGAQILGELRGGDWLLILSPWGPGWVRARFGEVFVPTGAAVPVVSAPAAPTPLPQPSATPAPTTDSQAIPFAVSPTPNRTPGVLQLGGAATGFELGGQIRAQGAHSIMQGIGMTWVKEQVRWERGETAQKAAQGAINAAHANGMKILISTLGHAYEMNGVDLNTYMDEYVQYLVGVAALNPDAIEVWNEPNIEIEWLAGRIDGATYTALLQKAYTAIKAVNPNVMVISAAPAPTGFFSGGCASAGCDDDVFIQQMAAAGAANYMDCIGIHYNEGIIPPDQNSGDPRGTHHSYYFRAMMDLYYSNFGGRLPLCFTEIGYLSAEGLNAALPPSMSWANNTTLQNQAEWLGMAATLARQSGRVRLMVVWNMNFDDAPARAGYAILRPDGGCPACAVLGEVMR